MISNTKGKGTSVQERKHESRAGWGPCECPLQIVLCATRDSKPDPAHSRGSGTNHRAPPQTLCPGGWPPASGTVMALWEPPSCWMHAQRQSLAGTWSQSSKLLSVTAGVDGKGQRKTQAADAGVPGSSHAQSSIPNSQEGLSPVPHPHGSPFMSSLLGSLTEGPGFKPWLCHSPPASGRAVLCPLSQGLSEGWHIAEGDRPGHGVRCFLSLS